MSNNTNSQVSQNDTTFELALTMVSFVYSIVLIVKLIGCNIKLIVNKLIILSLISDMIMSVTSIIINVTNLNNIQTSNAINLVLGIMLASSVVTNILSFILVINLRNNILIENKRTLIFTKILISVLIPLLISFFVLDVMLTSSWTYLYLVYATGILDSIVYIMLNILDLTSNVYLIIYYQKYYFNSKSIMNHLRFQMIYRRNWIYFVIFLEIISFGSVIMTALAIFPYTNSGFLSLVSLFELNTMIDFVRFDTVRNEITIGDQTVYFYEERDLKSHEVCEEGELRSHE